MEILSQVGVAVVSSLTVLLPTYNGARFLPEQLESLRRETDAAFHVLLQDDGSSDGTVDYLHSLEDGPLFSFGAESGRHLGAKGNFLSLMRQADTPYAALCDQDDVWEPERLSIGRQFMAEAEARFGADTPILVHSDCAVTDETGRVLHGSFFAHQGWDPKACTLSRLLVQNNVTGCTVLMNRALYRLAADHADPARIFMHDWFLAQTAAAFGQIVFIPQPLVRYRQHGANAVGASRGRTVSRAVHALRRADESRERIALTYEQAAVFRECYGGLLPEAAGKCVEAYLHTRELPKWRRIRAVRQGSYTMQSRTARWGQILFG